MPRPIQARIDLSALRHNCARVRSQTPSARVWAVLKADAYGHGLLRVARSLAANVEGFAVLELSAAITLRNAGLKEGTSTALDLIDAQLNLAKVQTERASSANQYVQALAALLESTGQSDAFAQYMARADILIPADAP